MHTVNVGKSISHCHCHQSLLLVITICQEFVLVSSWILFQTDVTWGITKDKLQKVLKPVYRISTLQYMHLLSFPCSLI